MGVGLPFEPHRQRAKDRSHQPTTAQPQKGGESWCTRGGGGACVGAWLRQTVSVTAPSPAFYANAMGIRCSGTEVWF